MSAPPRKIVVSSRKTQLDVIDRAVARLADKAAAVVETLSKPHVDDKAAAKVQVARAKKIALALGQLGAKK